MATRTCAFRILQPVHHVGPAVEVGARRRRDLEGVQHRLIEAGAVIGQRRLVDRFQVIGGDDGIGADVAEQRDFGALLFRNRVFGAADEDVGRDADGAQFLHRVLGRLGLQLAAGGEVGQQREVHEDALAAGAVLTELADRLEERQPLDIAHGAADLAQLEIDLVLAHGQEILDLVGDVRDHLDGLAEIVAAAFLFQHVGIDPPRRDGIGAPGGDPGEAFVVAEVEVGFRTVVGDEDLAMLKGRHRAGIDVQVGVELPQPDGKAAGLQQGAKRGRCEALAEAGNDAAGDEDVACHAGGPP
jgi:hypothetical protein